MLALRYEYPQAAEFKQLYSQPGPKVERIDALL